MTQAELLMHITNLAPPDSPDVRTDGTSTYVNQSRRRRKQQQLTGS